MRLKSAVGNVHGDNSVDFSHTFERLFVNLDSERPRESGGRLVGRRLLPVEQRDKQLGRRRRGSDAAAGGAGADGRRETGAAAPHQQPEKYGTVGRRAEHRDRAR